ncbi:MAG: type II toxin-antitoxin system RelE/ParE family toxin [Planctomycetales bacterium]|nr:type II toxin-antitoxin system RelE/ParE family toxin [Planctomycetales bacterium]MCA9227227.1 type II toxin-antitoxin system RelE/ParE family toxin [Planctomycetales bacterium]
MPYRVLITAKAEADVEVVLRWFRDQRAARAGKRWFNQLMAKLDALESDPERFPVAPESAEIAVEIREFLLGRKQSRFRVLFRIDGQTVTILRLWHGARDSITRRDVT